VEAMRLGAFSYITKPFDADEVMAVSRNALESEQLHKEVKYYRSQRKEIKFDSIIGKNSKLKDIFTMIQKISNNNSTILISGESGTGKELIARAIHSNSLRKEKPFIAINCAGIPDNLLESELFGHEKGAFTDASCQKLGMFELAHEGTLLLDEISDLKLNMQAKLLRVLEEKEVKRVGGTKMININVRIISATNTNLIKAVQDGTFRKDLYYRLNVVPINLPPLRERKDDIPLLAGHFIKIFNRKFKKNIQGITDKALECLINYTWPGNIRELKNIIERLIVLKDEGLVDKKDLPFDIFIKCYEAGNCKMEGRLKKASASFQKQYIEAVLERVNGNQIKAAEILGIHRNALFNKIREFGVKK
ncbi:MAG: sigma-54 dependent transcriptional regulator, partial [Bacteroidota bacterium]